MGGDWGDIDRLIRPACEAAFAQATVTPVGELSVVLTNDAHIHQLNRDFRDKDGATNVLSFPQAEGAKGNTRNFGDVVLAFETLTREAQEQGKHFADHLSHMLVHGVLHLLGYDHLDDDEAEAMEALEVAALQRLSIDNPYRVTHR